MTNDKNIWAHQATPGRNLTGIVLAAGIMTLTVILFVPTNDHAAFPALLIMFSGLIAFLARSRPAGIRIDRNERRVVKTAEYLFIKTEKSYELNRFSSVLLNETAVPFEGGYRLLNYDVVLTGPGLTLEVYSSGNKQEAQSVQRKMSEFLSLPAASIHDGN